MTPRAETERIIVSYSELDTFRQCPLKHQWAYKERWQEEAKPGGALARGILWHAVMQAHYGVLQGLQGTGKTPKRPRDRKQRESWLAQCRLAVAPLLCDTVTGVQSEDQALVEWMYDGYVQQWGLDVGGQDERNWRILAVEMADVMPMPRPDGRPSARFSLKTKIDLVVEDLRWGGVWVVDHKSGQNLPYDKDLDLDDQFGLYALMLRVNRGIKCSGVIYNAARTQRNKGPMALTDRFAMVPMPRMDEELREVARDALAAAVAAYGRRTSLGTYSSPNPQQCSWKCGFREAHLLERKGVPHASTLPDFGFRQDFTRH